MPQIALHEVRGFIIWVRHFRRGVIPVKISYSPFLQSGKETFFSHREGIQSDKYNLCIGQVATFVFLHLFDNFPENHTFISFAFGGKRFPQIGI
ncbi:Uncharacterised protein [Parabacteroides merdae]|nr:Uncharacterised protein [Parabacteroides merdae]